MRKFIFVLLTLLLVSPFSFAMKGIIWQPQNRDSQVTDTQWQGLMSQLRLQGFDTLVLQWTRYGDAFTQPEQRTLLFKRAAAAQHRNDRGERLQWRDQRGQRIQPSDFKRGVKALRAFRQQAGSLGGILCGAGTHGAGAR